MKTNTTYSSRLLLGVVSISRWSASALSTVAPRAAQAFPLVPLSAESDATIPEDQVGTLASLFGSEENRDVFFWNYFGTRNPVHIRRSQVERQELEFMRGTYSSDNLLKELFETCPYATIREFGQPKSIENMIFEDFASDIERGCSAVIPVHSQPSFQPLKRSLQESFQKPVSMTIYHSGPNGSALLPHTDSYDVFVIQMEGCKDWEIVQGYGETRKATEFTLQPGDVLYIPYNVIHSAKTTEGVDYSTHLTIGLLNKWKPEDTLSYANSINTSE